MPPRLAAMIIFGGACAADAGRPPVARIALTPDTIVENDGYQTAVTLDARASADPIDDPEGQAPLRYAWTIAGDDFRYDTGRATSAAPVVRFRGDYPATITVVVTDDDGRSAAATEHLRLTVR